jgi:hypothetical protein
MENTCRGEGSAMLTHCGGSKQGRGAFVSIESLSDRVKLDFGDLECADDLDEIDVLTSSTQLVDQSRSIRLCQLQPLLCRHCHL